MDKNSLSSGNWALVDSLGGAAGASHNTEAVQIGKEYLSASCLARVNLSGASAGSYRVTFFTGQSGSNEVPDRDIAGGVKPVVVAGQDAQVEIVYKGSEQFVRPAIVRVVATSGGSPS